MWHPALVYVPFAGEAEQRFNQVDESLTGRDLHPHDRRAVSLVPPVVPHARLDLRLLTGSENRLSTVEQHRQLTVLDAESLNQRGMHVLTHHAGTGHGGQDCGRAAFVVRPGQINEDGALPRHRVFPDLAYLDRACIRWRKQIGMQHQLRLYPRDDSLIPFDTAETRPNTGGPQQPQKARPAAEIGDRDWHALLDAHDAVVRSQLVRFRGREVNTSGDGFLAMFDGPQRAIRCAMAIRDAVQALGIQVRAGLHTGECEVRGDDIGGIGVHIGARVSALAGPNDVLVSGTLRDLVIGSGLEFDDRGAHGLKGVPGEWQLFAVASP